MKLVLPIEQVSKLAGELTQQYMRSKQNKARSIVAAGLCTDIKGLLNCMLSVQDTAQLNNTICSIIDELVTHMVITKQFNEIFDVVSCFNKYKRASDYRTAYEKNIIQLWSLRIKIADAMDGLNLRISAEVRQKYDTKLDLVKQRSDDEIQYDNIRDPIFAVLTHADVLSNILEQVKRSLSTVWLNNEIAFEEVVADLTRQLGYVSSVRQGLNRLLDGAQTTTTVAQRLDRIHRGIKEVFLISLREYNGPDSEMRLLNDAQLKYDQLLLQYAGVKKCLQNLADGVNATRVIALTDEMRMYAKRFTDTAVKSPKSMDEFDILKCDEMFVEQRCGRSRTTHFNESVHVITAINTAITSNAYVVCVRGKAGMGKSMMLRELAKRMMTKWLSDSNAPYPLLINLSGQDELNLISVLKSQLIDCFSLANLNGLLCSYNIIVLCDSYDDLKKPMIMNERLGPNVKIVVASRDGYLERVGVSKLVPKPEVGGYIELYLLPFNEMQCKAFVDNFVTIRKHHSIIRSLTHSEPEAYMKDLHLDNPLTNNPFFLGLLVWLLPVDPAVGSITTQSGVISHFMTAWFARAQQRIQTKVPAEFDLAVQGPRMCMAMARVMFASNMLTIDVADHKQLFICDDVDKYYLMRLIREACPLVSIGTSTYSFLHKSLYEYYVGMLGLLGSEAEPPCRMTSPRRSSLSRSSDILTVRLITEDIGILKYVSQQLTPTSERRMWELVYNSARDNNDASAVAAANAISVLAWAGVCFVKRKFVGVRIPRANVAGTSFYGSEFVRCDLRGVVFVECTLDAVKMTECDLTDAVYGRQPSLVGHTGAVTCLCATCKYILTGSHDNSVRLYDIVTGKELKVLELNVKPVTCVAADAAGRFIASSSNDDLVMYDLNTDKTIWSKRKPVEKRELSVLYTAPVPPVFCGNSVAVLCDEDKSVVLYDVASGREIKKLEGCSSVIRSLWYESHTLCCCTSDGTIVTFNTDTSQSTKIAAECRSVHNYCIFSSDGSLVACCNYDRNAIENTVIIRDSQTGKIQCELTGHYGYVYYAAFNHDGRVVATAANDKIVRVWDSVSGEQIYEYEGSVSCMTYSHDSKLLIGGCYDGTIKMWNTATIQHKVYDTLDAVDCVSFSPDSEYLASCSIDRQLRLWETRCALLHDIIPGQFYGAVAYSNTSKRIAGCERVQTSGTTAAVVIYDIETNTKEHLGITQRPLTDISFSADDKFLLCCSSRGCLMMFDLTTNEEINLQVHKMFACNVKRASFTPDSDALVIMRTYGSNIEVWANPDEIREMKGHTNTVNDMCFSSLGILATAGDDKTVRLWDIVNYREIKKIDHPTAVTACSFSPDGNIIISGAADGVVRLFDVSSGKEIRKFEGHTKAVTTMVCSKDGRTFATGSLDKTVRLYTNFRNDDYSCAVIGKPDLRAKGIMINRCKMSLASATLLTQLGGIVV